MGDDGAGHARAVLMRLESAADGVEALGDAAAHLRVGRLDAGIDDGDRHLLAAGEEMGLGQAQLVDDILQAGAAALRRGRACRRKT